MSKPATTPSVAAGPTSVPKHNEHHTIRATSNGFIVAYTGTEKGARRIAASMVLCQDTEVSDLELAVKEGKRIKVSYVLVGGPNDPMKLEDPSIDGSLINIIDGVESQL